MHLRGMQCRAQYTRTMNAKTHKDSQLSHMTVNGYKADFAAEPIGGPVGRTNPNLKSPKSPLEVMLVPDELMNALAQADLTTEDLAMSLTKALSSTRAWSAIPEVDRAVMLAESGLPLGKQVAVRKKWESLARDTATRSIMSVTRLLNLKAFTTDEVANRLSVNQSTITRRISKHQLLADRDARGRLRMPAWQFTETGALPGWDHVAPALAGVERRTVEAFMSTEQDELDGLSAHQWLLAGNDPGVVAELAKGVTQW